MSHLPVFSTNQPKSRTQIDLTVANLSNFTDKYICWVMNITQEHFPLLGYDNEMHSTNKKPTMTS